MDFEIEDCVLCLRQFDARFGADISDGDDRQPICDTCYRCIQAGETTDQVREAALDQMAREVMVMRSYAYRLFQVGEKPSPASHPILRARYYELVGQAELANAVLAEMRAEGSL